LTFEIFFWRLESQIAEMRVDNERQKIELEQKASQLDIMGHTLEIASVEAKKSVSHVETLQVWFC